MLFEISYDIDYSALFEYIDLIETRLNEASELKKAVESGGDYFVQTWIDVAQSKFKHSQGDYARGIVEGTQYPYNGDPLVFHIKHKSVTATYLEKGYDSFDMKKMLYTSDKVRISKDGKRYIIIPFTHGTPGSKTYRAMPDDIYAEAKLLKPSTVIGAFKEGSIKEFQTPGDAKLLNEFNPVRVMRRGYEWGNKLTHVMGKELPKESIYKNMVRFQANPNINREKIDLGKFSINLQNESDNQQDYSHYMTFRAMVEGSSGWIHPGIKPMNILGETTQKCKEHILQTIALGARKDMERAIAARGEGLI